MRLLAHLLGATIALSLATDALGLESPAAWRTWRGFPDLAVHLELGAAEGPRLTMPTRRAGRAVPPPCIVDVCQAIVEVPGFETKFHRPHRTELFASLLDRVGLEPFATISWWFVVTGLRVDWSPPTGGGDPAGSWGSAFVRLRLRMDAMNRPVIPLRARAHAPQRSWAGFLRS